MSDPRILVIGAAGFVGRHLTAALEAEHGADAIVAAGREDARVALDILDGEAVRRILGEVRPTHVVNLAGIAVPGVAADDEAATWSLHLGAVMSLGQAILRSCPAAWLLQVGSGLAYGRTARHGRPVREDEALEPNDTYGASKAAGDIAIGALAARGLKAVRLRPFNHTGPGQTADFVVPAFARQIARIEAGLHPPIIDVGNLASARDFLDVRDVAGAYAAVIRHVGALEPGAILNVASGSATVIHDLLDQLLSMSTTRIDVRPDPARQRAGDLPTISGDASALKNVTGWEPSIGPERMLHDVLEAQRVTTGRR